MKAMFFSQSRIPLDLLCLPSKNPDRGANPLYQIPLRPRDVILSKESFKTVLRPTFNSDRFSLDNNSGPAGYRVMIPNLPTERFCVQFGSSTRGTTAHVEVILSKSLGSDACCPKGVYLYFATVASHELLRDTKHRGACFLVRRDDERTLGITYTCSFHFKLCRNGSCRTGRSPTLPALLIQRGVKVVVDIGDIG